MKKADNKERASKLLTEVGISEPRERLVNFPHQFSGGQLQRIGIALALAEGCELLIADEPTTALDVTIQAQIVSLLLRLKKTRGLSIIFISHNIELVAQISDRIAVMYGGKIVESGTAEQVYNHPGHDYTKALLSCLPQFGMHYTASDLKTYSGSFAPSEGNNG
ncbi:ATP-binding cassette domain-containing protein [Treponema parvum]|uniref:ATP-binding cassette domain-containing protein n=1 Tax=Treponema parvum TaxID=138851 RepID=UPI001AEBB9C8|nr:ATP-binding cassette domain-containing protein [Treponema parvum]QTQ17412.1 ABC transporter ATP-binding protein [Treponema parvum]